MDNEYPFRIKASAEFIAELARCESGRHEDAVRKREDGETVPPVLGDFIDRFKTRIEIRSEDELRELWFALTTGTIGLYQQRAANRVLDLARERMRAINPHDAARHCDGY